MKRPKIKGEKKRKRESERRGERDEIKIKKEGR